MGHELTVRGVVHGLDPDDALDERVVVPMNVRQEMKLRGGRADDEDLRGILQRTSNLVEVPLLVDGMAMLGGGARVLPDVMTSVLDPRRVEALAVEVEDLRFVLVEPENGMAFGHERLRCEVHARVEGPQEVRHAQVLHAGRGTPGSRGPGVAPRLGGPELARSAGSTAITPVEGRNEGEMEDGAESRP